MYPHLPNDKIKSVILGEKYKKILHKSFEKLEITPIYIKENKNIENELSSHIDMLMCQVDEKTFVCEPSIDVDFPVVFGKTKLKKGYPNNIAYNGLLVGEHFFHNLKYTDEIILKKLPKGTKIHDVKQGFAKCMVSIVDENSVITSDKGMAKAMSNYIKDILLIEPGFIDLEGFDYGFIGGSSFKIQSDIICFTGSLENHPSKQEIFDFLAKKSIQIEYLTPLKIFDICSILTKFF